MISANGVEYKNLPEQVQYLTERAAEFAVELNRVSASLEGVTTSVESLQANVDGLQTDVADMQTALNNYDSRINAIESTVAGLQTSLTTAQNTANVALTKAESALSMIAGLHSLTKEEVEFEGDSVAITGFVEGSLCTLTKLDGNTKASGNLLSLFDNDFERGAISASTNQSYNNCKQPSTTRIRTTNLFKIDGSKTYTIKCFSDYQLVVQAFREDGTMATNVSPFNQWGNSVTFSGYPYIAIAIKKNDIDEITITDFDKARVYLIQGSTAPTSFVPYYTGLKSVSISGLSTGGGVVITTSEGTTSLIPTLDDDTLELGSYDYMEQVINDTQLTTSIVIGGELIHLTSSDTWNDSEISSLRRMVIYIEEIKSVSGRTDDVICDKFSYSGNTSNEGTFFHNAKWLYFFVPASVTTLAEWKTYLDSIGGIYVYIILETPVTTVLATVTYTDVSAFFEAGAAITVNNANTEYGVESTSTMYGYVAE